MLAGTFPKRPQVSWLIPLVWFVLSFKGIRQAPLFAITAAVAIADMWRHTLWHRLLVKYGDGSLATDKPSRDARRRMVGSSPRSLVLISFQLQVAKVEVPLIGSGWVRLRPELRPRRLTPAVLRYVNRPARPHLQRREPRRLSDLPRAEGEDLHGRPL